MSQEEIEKRLEELKEYKSFVLQEQKEAKIVLMYSNIALQSVLTEQEILKEKLAEMQEIS